MPPAPPTQGVLALAVTQPAAAPASRVRGLLRSLLLPPDTPPPLRGYALWLTVEVFLNRLAGTLAMQALFLASATMSSSAEDDPSNPSAAPQAPSTLSAAASWILKDVLGQLLGLLLAAWMGGGLDAAPKTARLGAALGLQLAHLLQAATLLLPATAFTPVASFASAAMYLGFVLDSASKAALLQNLILYKEVPSRPSSTPSSTTSTATTTSAQSSPDARSSNATSTSATAAGEVTAMLTSRSMLVGMLGTAAALPLGEVLHAAADSLQLLCVAGLGLLSLLAVYMACRCVVVCTLQTITSAEQLLLLSESLAPAQATAESLRWPSPRQAQAVFDPLCDTWRRLKKGPANLMPAIIDATDTTNILDINPSSQSDAQESQPPPSWLADTATVAEAAASGYVLRACRNGRLVLYTLASATPEQELAGFLCARLLAAAPAAGQSHACRHATRLVQEAQAAGWHLERFVLPRSEHRLTYIEPED